MKCKNCCHYNVCSNKDRAEEVNKKIEGLNLEDDLFEIKLSCKEYLINPKTTTEPLWGVIRSNIDKVGKVGKKCKDVCEEEYKKDKGQ